MNTSPLHSFVGHEDVLADLHQFLSAPAPYALSLQAMEGLGRSSLLRRLGGVDDRFVCALIPITAYSVTHEGLWLETLATAARTALERDDFDPARLPAPNAENLREWFMDVFLPFVGHLLHGEARLIWLLDDVQVLAAAIAQEAIPADHPVFLDALLTRFPFVSILTSADEDAPHLELLVPLVQIAHVVRLAPLTRRDVDALLAAALEYVPGVLSDRVYHESGGLPRPLNELAEALQRFEPLDEAIDSAYERSQTSFRRQWSKLTRDERVVLTAIVNLIYDDPVRPITLALLEQWLTESDDLMDSTAIAAQVRGLEYRYMLRSSRQELILRSGLWQRWLLEHARLDAPTAARRSRWTGLLIVTALVMLVLLVAIGMTRLPAAGVVIEPPLPTLTLGE